MITEKSCGAVLFRRTGNEAEFLVIQESHGGQWGFPKGHMENGESEQETAIREILEETGVTAELLAGFREATEYPLPNGNQKQAVIFLADASGCTVSIREGEIISYAWLHYSEMSERLSFRGNKLILAKAADFINNNL